MDDEVEQGRARLQWAQRLLACFQQALGHELPNDLVAIQGLLQVLALEAGPTLDAAGREYIARLQATTQRTHELIAALAAVGRACRAQEKAERVELSEVVREAGTRVNQLFPRHRIEYDLSQPNLWVQAPPAALRLVVFHVLKHVALSCGIRPLDIQVGGRQMPSVVEFWAADNGPGMAAEQRALVFEPFRGAGGGSEHGLDLFLARQLVESWGGTIGVQAGEQHGSTYTVTIPCV